MATSALPPPPNYGPHYTHTHTHARARRARKHIHTHTHTCFFVWQVCGREVIRVEKSGIVSERRKGDQGTTNHHTVPQPLRWKKQQQKTTCSFKGIDTVHWPRQFTDLNCSLAEVSHLMLQQSRLSILTENWSRLFFIQSFLTFTWPLSDTNHVILYM